MNTIFQVRDIEVSDDDKPWGIFVTVRNKSAWLSVQEYRALIVALSKLSNKAYELDSRCPQCGEKL